MTPDEIMTPTFDSERWLGVHWEQKSLLLSGVMESDTLLEDLCERRTIRRSCLNDAAARGVVVVAR